MPPSGPASTTAPGHPCRTFSIGREGPSRRPEVAFAYHRAMATYACPTCGLSVNATCGECDAPLVNDTIQRDDGSSVQVSKCPNGHGKIKSPMCCGADMSCSVA